MPARPSRPAAGPRSGEVRGTTFAWRDLAKARVVRAWRGHSRGSSGARRSLGFTQTPSPVESGLRHHPRTLTVALAGQRACSYDVEPDADPTRTSASPPRGLQGTSRRLGDQETEVAFLAGLATRGRAEADDPLRGCDLCYRAGDLLERRGLPSPCAHRPASTRQ